MQTQDGVLKNADKILNRLSELAQLSADVTKSDADRTLYQTEFNGLTAALEQMALEDFNGIALFSTGVGTLSVVTSENGEQSFGITQVDLNAIAQSVGAVSVNISSGADSADIAVLTTGIQNLANARAQNGAEQSRLSFSADLLAINKVNLEAANSRIIDVDVASESANLARLNILQQAGTAMLAQANQSQQSILRLLV
jgi:flagellin